MTQEKLGDQPAVTCVLANNQFIQFITLKPRTLFPVRKMPIFINSICLRILKKVERSYSILRMSEADVIKSLPNRLKYQLAKKNVKFYIIDANSLARELGLGRHTNTILQASFFYLNPSIMPYEQALEWMKKFAEKTYFRKGEKSFNKTLTQLMRSQRFTQD